MFCAFWQFMQFEIALRILSIAKLRAQFRNCVHSTQFGNKINYIRVQRFLSMYSSCCIRGTYSLKIKSQYSCKMYVITTEQSSLCYANDSLLELKGSSSIAQLSDTACRKMLALLDHLELSVFHIVLLVLRNVTPGPWILKPVASGVRWAQANPLFHK